MQFLYPSLFQSSLLLGYPLCSKKRRNHDISRLSLGIAKGSALIMWFDSHKPKLLEALSSEVQNLRRNDVYLVFYPQVQTIAFLFTPKYIFIVIISETSSVGPLQIIDFYKVQLYLNIAIPVR